MKNYRDLEWYVLLHDFNTDKIEHYNIFHNANLWSDRIGIPKLLKDYATFDNFKKELESLFKYCFWAKSEYEILVSGLIGDKQYKIDVWEQIKPNLDLIARYIIETYNKRKRKKIEV